MKIWINLSIFLFSTIAFASQCNELTGWLKSQDQLLEDASDWRERADLVNQIRDNEYNSAWHIYERYQKGLLTPEFFTECMDHPSLEQLKVKVSAEFKDRSLENLEGSQSSKIKKLVSDIKKSNSLFIFQAEFESSDTPRKAGFHRMSGAMYYVLPDIPHNEFKLHLVHELLHKYDENVLYETSLSFSDKETNVEIYELAQNHQVFSELDSKNQKLVREYVLNGLRRGFLAEFKVWSASYRLYLEMREHDEIDSLPWVESLLLEQLEGEKYLDFIFRYYSSRFERPERESLFQWDLLQDSYDVVMGELSQVQNKCQLMDDLSVFIRECR